MSTQREITIYSSKGVKQKITTDATTWGELKPLVEEHFDLQNLQATENINKTTLENEQALLPVGTFVLFLRAIKTKSGLDYKSLSFKDLRAQLSPSDKTALTEKTGKNWTRVSRTSIEEHLQSKSAAGSPVVYETVSPVSEPKVAEEPVVEGKRTLIERIKEIKDLTKSIKKDSPGQDVKNICETILNEVKELKSIIEYLADPEAAENEALRKEFEALNAGF